MAYIQYPEFEEVEEVRTYRQHVRDRIQANELDQIMPYNGPLIYRDDMNIVEYWLIIELCQLLPITYCPDRMIRTFSLTPEIEKVWETLHRLILNVGNKRWMQLYIHSRHGLDGLLTWIDRGWISLNQPKFLADLLDRPNSDRSDALISFMDSLLDRGLNLNDEVWCGQTILLYFLDRILKWRFTVGLKKYLKRIVFYLLARGANPLLEDHKGRNAMAMVAFRASEGAVDPDIEQWLMTELKRWI